jgi:FkbM family methyltransferase
MPFWTALYTFVAHVARRPEPARRRALALARFGYRQLHKRLTGDALVVPWEGLRLEVPVDAKSAASAFYFGRHDGWEFAFIERLLRPGDVVADVGANAGVYALFLARCVGPSGRVVAFEPERHNLALLRRQLDRNALAQVEVVEAAVGDRPGTARFLAHRDAVGRFAHEGEAVADVVEVPVTTFDARFPGDAPVFVKVDVEGFEVDVLRGAEALLARGGPLAWQLEISDGGAGRGPDVLAGLLTGAGYSFFRYDPRAGLVAWDWRNPDGNNLLAIRDLPAVLDRLASPNR